MNRPSDQEIASIIHNQPLASAVHTSVASALLCPFARLAVGQTTWDVFKHSLDAAIRDIQEHPRGKLFRRLIEYGPHNPDDPEAPASDGKTILSDPECGLCVDFIFSHMVNRFKGELAELLALEPCIALVQRLQQEGHLSSSTHLYWGDAVQERRQTRLAGEEHDAQWGSFTKGADGILAEPVLTSRSGRRSALRVRGVIEVKSMSRSHRRVIAQITKHITRMRGGVRLGDREWLPDEVSCSNVIRIMVLPATWKLSREYHGVKTGEGTRMVLAEPSEPPAQTQVEELEPGLWKITLAWSQESLDEAAYEMTFWYMSQVGRHVYAGKPVPMGWESMTPEEAGYNAIKMMLYYILLRHMPERQRRRAIRLYNVYSYGYPIGSESGEMLWPEDVFKEVDDSGGQGHRSARA